jgi:hypothetical protein
MLSKELNEALSNIDTIISKLNLSREGHITLMNNLNLIKITLEDYVELKKETEKEEKKED